MTCQKKKSTIPNDPIQLSIGLWGPPKKAASRLKNSHRLDILIMASSAPHDCLYYASRSDNSFSTSVPGTIETYPLKNPSFSLFCGI
jgi:hypothetical protein